MLTLPRSRDLSVLLLLTALMLAHPQGALAERVDINDPTVLGPVVRRDFILDANDYERIIAEVRYLDGLYSYIYAVRSDPYTPGTSCCEAYMLSYEVTGHPLEDRWGAINGSDVFWTAFPEHPGTTKRVESIDPIHDGFFVLPERAGSGAFAVVYVRSPQRPSSHGALIYTGQVRDHDQGGILRTESFQFDNVVVPTPEPGSIVLFGLGLASMAATRRASRRRRIRRASQSASTPLSESPDTRIDR